MADCFSKSELTDFCNLMKLPDGTPLLPIDMLDWLAMPSTDRYTVK